MKAAIYVTKKPQDGLQAQVEQAFAVIDKRGWEMTRMIHQDELSEEHKLDAFMLAVKGGEFTGLALPSLDVFPVPVLDALSALGVELEVYDPEAVERGRKANEALAKQQERGKAAKAAKTPNFEAMATEPWKVALLNKFLKKDE
jgi:hypothetical protein